MGDFVSFSQAGQDEWVHSIVGDSGFFVDVGAHDGIVHSNTYALEQLGWTGLCIDANSDAFLRCKANRPGSQHSLGIVSDHQGFLNFDGITVTAGGSMPVICARLEDFLDRNETPTVIDYLSIDVEGHDLQVLKGMDFDRWHVHLVTVEHNLYLEGPVRKDAIHAHLTEQGFERVIEDVVAPGYGHYEDWYRNLAALSL